MDKSVRNAIERATQALRHLLEEEFEAQLEGTFDILADGTIAQEAAAILTPEQGAHRDAIVAAIDRKLVAGMKRAEAVADYLRDTAFTTLNRFVALKMLEARGLVQQCVSRGQDSSGYGEFTGMAPGLLLLPDGRGYRLYLESLFDELSTEVKVLFDRRDPAAVLWPRRAAFDRLLEILNGTELAGIWGDDETIGWVYQFFNGAEERKKMREESQAPRNSRELAVRNQFFTPRYVVQFLTDNTLGRTWVEMTSEQTSLLDSLEYLVRSIDEPFGRRRRKDPRDLRVLDPACGSGHFLLYAFDLLLTIYEEAWSAADAPASDLTRRTLREDYQNLDELRAAAPALVVEHNLYGVDIDARCAQIAALALWLRAQRAYRDLGLKPEARPQVRRTHIVIAEPMPGDRDLALEFATELDKPFLQGLFSRMVEEMRLAGELGTLLQSELSLASDVSRARRQFQSERQTLFPGLRATADERSLDLSGITDEAAFHDAEETILASLRRFAESAGGGDARRRLFAGDAAQGVALIDLVRTRFDVILMNPPFGAASLAAKKEFEKAYPRTKNDIYAAFVERGIQLLHPGGMLGAITSRTGFFLSSFQKWREEILLKQAPPVVFADLGYGVMDAAMVEAAAYCLMKVQTVATR
jgi:Eco57I restriction-modification methylase